MSIEFFYHKNITTTYKILIFSKLNNLEIKNINFTKTFITLKSMNSNTISKLLQYFICFHASLVETLLQLK